MKAKNNNCGNLACLLLTFLMLIITAVPAKAQEPARKILIVGDSMTGWMSERLEAYGQENGFEVSTVVWDGSTISKWGKSRGLKDMLNSVQPDAVLICLGMNDLFEANPEKRLRAPFNSIMETIGDIPVVWVGPPSWPGQKKGETLNNWLEEQMGEGHFFRSSQLQLERQSARNPHPSRKGMIKWTDALVDWLETDGAVKLPGYSRPADGKMTRGKTFVYKKMKDSF